MSDSHEPSYYEIALTNRQVVVAFVILLVCLIAAFFSGVWVGRESGIRAAEQMAQNTLPPGPEEPEEGQNLEELEFFGAEQQPASPPEPAPERTLAEEVGARQPEPAPSRPAAPETSPAPEPRPERTPPRREPAEQEPRPRPAQTGAPVPAEPARAAGQVVIQVFSSPEEEQAERIRARLVGGGHRAFLSPVEVGGRTMYRVRIGPFTTRDEAQKVAEQVRKGYKLDTWVTE